MKICSKSVPSLQRIAVPKLFEIVNNEKKSERNQTSATATTTGTTTASTTTKVKSKHLSASGDIYISYS
jgi:hypothetical protein